MKKRIFAVLSGEVPPSSLFLPSSVAVCNPPFSLEAESSLVYIVESLQVLSLKENCRKLSRLFQFHVPVSPRYPGICNRKGQANLLKSQSPSLGLCPKPNSGLETSLLCRLLEESGGRSIGGCDRMASSSGRVKVGLLRRFRRKQRQRGTVYLQPHAAGYNLSFHPQVQAWEACSTPPCKVPIQQSQRSILSVLAPLPEASAG